MPSVRDELDRLLGGGIEVARDPERLDARAGRARGGRDRHEEGQQSREARLQAAVGYHAASDGLAAHARGGVRCSRDGPALSPRDDRPDHLSALPGRSSGDAREPESRHSPPLSQLQGVLRRRGPPLDHVARNEAGAKEALTLAELSARRVSARRGGAARPPGNRARTR